MRIRFITATPLNVIGGSGTFVGIDLLARGLRRLGVAVDVVAPSTRFPIYTLHRLAFNQTLRFLKSDSYDLTLGFDMDGYTVAGKPGSIHVACIKGVIADEMRFETGFTKYTMRIQSACEALHVRRADSVITTSGYASSKIQEFYRTPRAPLIVPEIIDLDAWSQPVRLGMLPGAQDKFVVLTVCRFYPRKRLNILLGAAERLRDKIPNLEIRIVGGGPEGKHLKDLCRRRNLDPIVQWRENISRAELAAEYSACDLFCLPTVQEGFGIVFLEAMAHGKPIVACRAGATPEVIEHGVHGILVEPDNAEELASAIQRLHADTSFRAALGASGLQHVRKYDAPLITRLFLTHLQELAGSKSGSSVER